ncbi:MAG: tRNA (uridine(34)/cytosine(34)/5-carboxymethylaminomethyluridine(34)-2'-O)-methyltransferase TrmL [Granulosicoccus sp.]
MSTSLHPLNVVLFEPEIPPNTGNIIRLCANTGANLHLIEPLGFSLDTKALRRAGLDYHETATIQSHPNLEACFEHLQVKDSLNSVFAVSTKGSIAHHDAHYSEGDVLLFGPETRGLPDSVLADPRVTRKIRIPMRAQSRSLNLSNAVSIITYEALRQMKFPDMA